MWQSRGTRLASLNNISIKWPLEHKTIAFTITWHFKNNTTGALYLLPCISNNLHGSFSCNNIQFKDHIQTLFRSVAPSALVVNTFKANSDPPSLVSTSFRPSYLPGPSGLQVLQLGATMEIATQCSFRTIWARLTAAAQTAGKARRGQGLRPCKDQKAARCSGSIKGRRVNADVAKPLVPDQSPTTPRQSAPQGLSRHRGSRITSRGWVYESRL